MESTKDGSEVISFQLKSKATVRIQFSMYQREDDIYFVPADVLLSDWKSQSSIIGAVNMQQHPGNEVVSPSIHRVMKVFRNLGFHHSMPMIVIR